MSYTPDKWTDKELEALEKRIAKVYKEAEQELTKEVNEYFAKFKIRDKEMSDLVDAGEMSNADYIKWRSTQMGRGQRFEALRDKVAERYTKANEVANAYVNDATPSIYSLNRNYEAYKIEKAVGSCDFTMWDESTVKRLLVEKPDLMPYYPPNRALNRGIDLAFGKDQITKRVTSGIIRGISPGKIANELMAGITTMNRESAVRAARTGITAAENAGRLDSWIAAEKMGIQIKRRWMCTKDARTRMSHGQADGQTVNGTKTPFVVGGYKMMFPGDKSLGAPGHEIYNCRCTTRTVEKDGIEAEPRQMRVRDPETGENVLVNEMTYSEWEKWKKGIANSGNSDIISAKPSEIDDVYDLSKYKYIADSEFNEWKKSCGISTAKEYKQINKHTKADGSNGGYVRSHRAWEFNADLRAGKEDLLDDDDKETLSTIRNLCKKNSTDRPVILDRFVDSDYLSEYSGFFNKHREDLIDDAISFVKKHMIGTNKTEKSVVSTSYASNVLTDRDIHIRLYCPKGTHMFVTKNKRESEVLFHDGLTYEIVSVGKESYAGLFGNKHRLVLNVVVKNNGL